MLAGCARWFAAEPSRRKVYDPGFGCCIVESESVEEAPRPETLPPRNCTALTTMVAPSDGNIDTSLAGRIENYLPGSRYLPKAERRGGSLHVMAHAPTGGESQFGGIVLRFTKCIDARAWKGVRFMIRGSFWGCSISFATSDARHEDRNFEAPFATGRHGSSPPDTQLELSWATQDAQTIQIPFADEQSAARAIPPLPIDTSELTSLRWKLSDSMTGRCVADFLIDDLSFY